VPSPVVFFQIATADPEKSRAFYQELFDWDVAASGLPVAPLSIDPKGPADFDPKGSFLQLPPGLEPYISVFVRVEDLSKTFARAQELGSAVVVPVTQIPTGAHIAIITTPEGHTLGLVQQ
jgi:predicted enzyme related to lactoylglutathione lyase